MKFCKVSVGNLRRRYQMKMIIIYILYHFSVKLSRSFINVSWKSILLGTLYKFTNSGVHSPSRYATAPCIADTWEPMIAPLSERDAPLR